ncbi:MAG: DUF1295 domain-containing protein [Gemmatimonadota bacterium]|nr:DUF1295 domain-containing protein [Gemmatimonadota bacterium]
MLPDPSLAAQGLAAALLLMTLVWLGSLATDDASLVDRFWGAGFVLLAWWYWAQRGGGAGPWFQLVFVLLITLWGLRLSLHITWRNWGHGEDPRYAAMRQAGGPGWRWRSLVTVFGLQALLLWVIATPLLVALTSSQSPQMPLVVVGVACWLVGFAFEAGGDWQLARFRANPANRGQVLNTGFWRYTRHPNYFGDAMCWWGFYCFAAAVGGWWTIFGPVLMTVLLMKVSGVALLEKSLVQAKPAYREYIRRTNAFIPGPRRP